MTTPIGLTYREKCDLIGNFELNCSMSQFDALAVILQQRALSHAALQRMTDNAAELGLDYAVEIRILGEEK